MHCHGCRPAVNFWAQDIEGERYLVLDSYDEAEEPYEDAFSQDVAADLYGATQINE